MLIALNAKASVAAMDRVWVQSIRVIVKGAPGFSAVKLIWIKHARMRVRLFNRKGYDWSHRFPFIVEAALRNRLNSFVIDGEAVLLGVNGISDFDGLHSRRHDEEVQFYAFDMLVSDGDDIRQLPLSMRKASLARLLARRVDGIFLCAFEQGEIGPDLFRHACLMGLAWLVSKRADSRYRGAARQIG
ncbi:ATP-dependent DNA ligase [Bradyrhizobium sp. AZCC 1578]|uniref:ATP-dependent DNA ligase n=1 Tax=Bradyrhizobium sp. AZCC 1578 TaxID=3117027 RepID=UPI002FEF54A6